MCGRLTGRVIDLNKMQDGFNAFIKKLSFADYLLVLAVFFLFVFYAVYLCSYAQLPSPVFGGDYYRDRGFVKNIVAGNPFWSDGFYANEIQYYPYLVFLVQACFVKLTGANLDKVFLLFPLLTLVLSSVVWYLLGSRLFKDKKWGLTASLYFLFFVYSINPKSSSVALFLLVPCFLYFWLRYEQEGKTKSVVYAAVLLGLTGLTWGGVFLGISATFALVLLYNFISDSVKEKAFARTLTSYFKKYYLIFIITVLISMLFFVPLFAKYGFNSVNKVTEWGDTRIELLGPIWVLKIFRNMFFDYQKLYMLPLTLVSLIGLFALIFAKKTREMRFILLIFVANIIIIQHHLLTRPLLNFSFLPEKLVYLAYLSPLFFAFGAKFISQQLNNEHYKKILFAAVIILLLITFFFKFNDFKNGQWQQVGFGDNTYISALYRLGDYIENTAGKNETILSNDESGFMLAVLSGRKVVLTRRTHANYYVDIDERIAEAAVALYGRNASLAREILGKYNVRYLYLDSNLLQYSMRTRPEFKDYLIEHNINFTEAYDRYDIAVPADKANLRNLLIIPPQEISRGFLELWEPVYSVDVAGQAVGQLLRLKSE
jgi:4-amino-4-deoxy-L-arabinose transferase-like glycosyltransferase